MTAFFKSLPNNPVYIFFLLGLFSTFNFVLFTIYIDNNIFEELQKLMVCKLYLEAIKDHQWFFNILNYHLKVCFLLGFGHEILNSFFVHLLRYSQDVN